MHHAIDQAAAKFPDQEAAVFQNRRLTYAGLVQRTHSLAHALVDQGVRRNDRVGIFLNKSLESLIAIYGIMKAGAAYVPLDPAMPTERLQHVIDDCNLHCLITADNKYNTLKQLTGGDKKPTCLIGLSGDHDLPVRTLSWENVAEFRNASPPDVRIIEQDLAYIMYTSGSTGLPKGIMHTHHSGLSYGAWAVREYDLKPTDRIANHTPLHFDISTFDFWGGALAGSTIVLIPEMHTRMPASYSQLLAEERITLIFTVPYALIQLSLRGVLHERDMSALRWVIYGGEPFPPKYMRALQQQWPRARFSNIYGPAEVNGVTFYHVPPIAERDETPIPIGNVCSFAEALVVDEQDQPCAPGETGEFLIRSPTMMQGYWGRPELNARAFYRRSIEGGYEAVYYRTGDLVRQGADGAYMFLGRKDRQIKIRGFRVELDEVEAALATHEQVEEAAVFSVPDDDGSRHIEAAVILQKHATETPADLVPYLKTRLAWYAIPECITVLDNFARTASGKIDRQSLQRQQTTAQME